MRHVVVLLALVLLVGLCVGPRQTRCYGSPANDASATVKQYAYEACPSWVAAHPAVPCPPTLEALNEYANRKTILDPWGTPYELLCNGTLAVVHSRGEDRIDDTADDIWSRDDLVHLATYSVVFP